MYTPTLCLRLNAAPRPFPSPQLSPSSSPKQLAVEANEAKNKAKGEVFTTVAQIEEATRQQQVGWGQERRWPGVAAGRGS